MLTSYASHAHTSFAAAVLSRIKWSVSCDIKQAHASALKLVHLRLSAVEVAIDFAVQDVYQSKMPSRWLLHLELLQSVPCRLCLDEERRALTRTVSDCMSGVYMRLSVLCRLCVSQRC